MSPPKINFQLVPDIRQGSKRAVGMLYGDQDLCAEKLTGLSEKDAKYNRYSMERWTGGLNGPNSRSHQFDGTPYFVFKQVAKMHRFYGFLCHPLPNTDASFQLCVLTTYAQKKENATDTAELGRVKAWMDAPATQAAIRLFYPDEKKDKK